MLAQENYEKSTITKSFFMFLHLERKLKKPLIDLPCFGWLSNAKCELRTKKSCLRISFCENKPIHFIQRERERERESER